MSGQDVNLDKVESKQSASESKCDQAASQSQTDMISLSKQGRISDLDKGKTSCMPQEFGGFELYDGAKELAKQAISDVANKVADTAQKISDFTGKMSEAIIQRATVIPTEEPKEEAPNKAPDYKGEPGINRDAPVQTATVKAGDTLESIARKHLGPDASVAEVAKHAQEIAKVNGIENPKMLHAGDKLQVPGHSKDGGFTTTDEQGNKNTFWPNGSYRFESKDGSMGVDRVPDGNGGYYEQGWGKKAEDNYKIAHDRDGQYLIVDNAGNKRRADYPQEEELIRRIRERDNASRRAAENDKK